MSGSAHHLDNALFTDAGATEQHTLLFSAYVDRFGLAFGASPPNSAGILGDPSNLGGLMFGVGAAPSSDLAGTIPTTVFFVFQMMFAVITPALIIGSIADRWVTHTTHSYFGTFDYTTLWCGHTTPGLHEGFLFSSRHGSSVLSPAVEPCGNASVRPVCCIPRPRVCHALFSNISGGLQSDCGRCGTFPVAMHALHLRLRRHTDVACVCCCGSNCLQGEPQRPVHLHWPLAHRGLLPHCTHGEELLHITLLSIPGFNTCRLQTLPGRKSSRKLAHSSHQEPCCKVPCPRWHCQHNRP